MSNNSKLELVAKDPDERILNLERLQIGMKRFELKGNTSDEDVMIHVLHNFPKEYVIMLDGLEKCLTLSSDDALKIEVIRV